MSKAASADSVLSTSPVFKKMANFKTFEKGDLLISEGDENGHVIFILSGRVKVSSFSQNGREVFHNEIGPGRTIGEMSAIDGGARTSTVTATQTTRAAILPDRDFVSLLKSDPEIAFWVMQDLVARLRTATSHLNGNVSQTLCGRICMEISALCPDDPDAAGPHILSPAPVLAQMARKLNTNRESVSREISALIKRGLLSREGKTLIVNDLVALRRQ